MKICWIEIENKTDILAFAAFLMSIGSLAFQFCNMIKGPKLILEPPKQVLIVPYADYGDEKYIRISATMTYFNKGSPGYHDIVKLEEAHIEFPDKKIILTGQKYVHSKEKKNDMPEIDIISDAEPVKVESGDVISHETYFVPFPTNTDSPNQNFIKYSDFLGLLEQNSHVDIKFVSFNLKSRDKKVTCRLKTSFFLEPLKQKEWTSTVCIDN